MLSAEFWPEAIKYWLPDANETMRRLESDQLVVITAPCGIGKSRLYSRALEEVCRKKGAISSTVVRDSWDDPIGMRLAPIDKLDQRLLNEWQNAGSELLNHPFLVSWLEEPTELHSHDSLQIMRRWVHKRRKSGKETRFVVNLYGRTLADRLAEPATLVNAAKNQGLQASHQELTIQHLPEDFLSTALIEIGVEERLKDFICSPNHKSLRTPRVIGFLYGDLATPPPLPRTSAELKKFLESPDQQHNGLPFLYRFYALRFGGSAIDLTKVFLDLGLFNRKPKTKKVAETIVSGEIDEQVMLRLPENYKKENGEFRVYREQIKAQIGNQLVKELLTNFCRSDLGMGNRYFD